MLNIIDPTNKLSLGSSSGKTGKIKLKLAVTVLESGEYLGRHIGNCTSILSQYNDLLNEFDWILLFSYIVNGITSCFQCLQGLS